MAMVRSGPHRASRRQCGFTQRGSGDESEGECVRDNRPPFKYSVKQRVKSTGVWGRTCKIWQLYDVRGTSYLLN